jgi:hypothetical protein
MSGNGFTPSPLTATPMTLGIKESLSPIGTTEKKFNRSQQKVMA